MTIGQCIIAALLSVLLIIGAGCYVVLLCYSLNYVCNASWLVGRILAGSFAVTVPTAILTGFIYYITNDN